MKLCTIKYKKKPIYFGQKILYGIKFYEEILNLEFSVARKLKNLNVKWDTNNKFHLFK